MTPDVGSDSPGTPPPGRLGAGGDHRADGAVRGVGRPRLRRRHLRSDPLRVGQHYRHRSSHRRSGQAQRCSSEHRPSSSSRVPHRIRLDRRPRRGGDRSGPPRAPSHRARTGCVESSSSPLTVGPFSSGTPVRPHLPQRPGSRRNVRKKSLIFQAFLRRRYWLGAPLRQMWTLCHPDESGYAAETPQAPSGGRPLTLVPHVSTATRAKGPLLARRGQGVSRVHRHARKGAARRGRPPPARPPPRPPPPPHRGPGAGRGPPPPPRGPYARIHVAGLIRAHASQADDREVVILSQDDRRCRGHHSGSQRATRPPQPHRRFQHYHPHPTARPAVDASPTATPDTSVPVKETESNPEAKPRKRQQRPSEA